MPSRRRCLDARISGEVGAVALGDGVAAAAIGVASAVAVLAELGTPAAVPKVFAVAFELAAPPRALLVAVAVELAKPPTPLLAPVPPMPPVAMALAVTALIASSLVAVAMEAEGAETMPAVAAAGGVTAVAAGAAGIGRDDTGGCRAARGRARGGHATSATILPPAVPEPPLSPMPATA